MTTRVLIIGGGAIGLSLAWEMSRRSSQVSSESTFEITILERGQIGKGTSWSAAGILPPANLDRATDPIDRLRGLSHQLFPKWASELEAATGIDVGLRRCGGWYLADTPGERASMLGMQSYWDELGIECESVPPDKLAIREPALRRWAEQESRSHPAAVNAAWWVPDEYQIRPPRYLQALARASLDRGVRLIENASVDQIRYSRSSPAVHASGHWHEADVVVVCGGPWAGQVAETLQLSNAIVPIRGQILLLKTDRPLVGGIVNVGHRYVMCRDDGFTLIGSCEEEKGFQIGTDDATLESLRQFALALIPELASAQSINKWSGLRPLTFDGFPMIGHVPDANNVWVAAGHFRSGLHLSPGTAVTLADAITGQLPAIDLSAFTVGKQQTHSA